MGGNNSKPTGQLESIAVTVELNELKNVKPKAAPNPQKFPLKEAWTNPIYLPHELQAIINDYHANHFDVSKYTLDDCNNFTLFGKNALPAFYAFEIGTHLLHGRRMEALTIARRYPKSMLCVTQVRDLLGRLVEGTPLQIAAAAGDHIPVLYLRELLTAKEAQAQLNAQFRAGWEQETKDRMEHDYLTPFKKFANTIIKTRLSSRGINSFNQAKNECKEAIREYRTRLRPNLNNSLAITNGLILDSQIYLDAYKFISTEINHLVHWNSIEMNLIISIGYQSLLGVSSAFFAQMIFKN